MDFSAQWCGPCKAIAPLFAQMAEKYKNLLFLKVDVDANQVPGSVLLLLRTAWCRSFLHACATYLSVRCQPQSDEEDAS